MKKRILRITPFAIGIACIIAYNIIGSEITPEGFLVEPFYLIPISYLFFCIGIIGLMIPFVTSFFCSRK